MAMANGYIPDGVGVGPADLSRLGHPQVQRQRSMNKFNLHPARPRIASKESTTSYPSSPVSPAHPEYPPPSLPVREDSLPHHQRAFPLLQNPRSNDPSRSFTSPAQIPQSLHRKPSEASRLRALNNGYRSHSSEGRHTPDRRQPDYQQQHPPDNFSRPRQPSDRRPRNASPNPSLLHGSATFPLQAHNEEPQQTAADLDPSRERGFSISSSQSATNLPESAARPPLRPSASIPDYQSPESIYSIRPRNLNNSSYRPARGYANTSTRPDSNSSGHRILEPPPRPPGYEDEEVRASFRSALTTSSSFLGTSGTERSSVMTKSSSATSIFGGRDEGMSVDDAIGMYEGGFQDSGMEDNYNKGTESDNRPESAASVEEDVKRRSRIEEATNDTLSLRETEMPLIHNSALTSNPISLPLDETNNSKLEAKEEYVERPTTGKPGTRAEPTSFDDTRDRYGFKKKSQYVSLEEYEKWNGPYKEYTARRRRKWVAMMKDNSLPTDHPTRFPAKSMKARRFVRKGIPADWRGAAWFFYAGGYEMLARHKGLYASLLKRAANGDMNETDDEIIERDLNRTFPDNARFKPDPAPGENRDSRRIEPETPILQSLRRVLQAFSIHNPKIGYCQSLNFLAGLLLLFMDEEKSFLMLNIITETYLPGTHEVNLEGANVDLGVLMTAIKDMMPSIWAKIGGELDGTKFDPHSMRLPPITLCTTAWFMSCFIGTLPIETTLRVWDSFFYEGSKTLFRIALTVFKVGEAEIKAVTDPMEIFQVVQTIPRRLVDANGLMEACFKRRNGFGHISQETIERGRAERRRGYAEERERAASGGGLVRRGTNKKKGGLFAIGGLMRRGANEI